MLALCACGWLLVITVIALWRRERGIPLVAVLLAFSWGPLNLAIGWVLPALR